MIKIIILALLILHSTSCGYWTKRENKPAEITLTEKLEKIRAKRARYCELSRPEYEANQFVVSRCDGLLFTGLHAVGCGYGGISQFEDNGRYYRNPAKDCFIPPSTNNGADSTTSKDMTQGVLTYLAMRPDQAAVERFIAYGEANKHALGWKIGEAADDLNAQSKIILPFTTIAVFKKMAGQHFPLVEAPEGKEGDAYPMNTGFRAHLDVQRQLAEGVIYGGISDAGLRMLKGQAERQAQNALFQAAYALYSNGDMNPAADLLLDETRWPADELPGSGEHCSDYLYQRDYSTEKDWVPCPDQNRVHSGTDFIIAATVALGEMKK